jgi:excisionase family DNA binding protein
MPRPSKIRNLPAKGREQAAARRPNQPWTVSEFAHEARCSDQHVYNLIRQGRIEALNLGGIVRIPDRVVRRLLGEDLAEITAA